MQVVGLDHFVLTVTSIERAVEFYERVLGMDHFRFGPDHRSALRFGDQKINLHQSSKEFSPRAARPWPGSADLCFLVDDIDAVAAHLDASDVPVVEGPGLRSGARGEIRSFYVRDPDGNLIELSAYV